MPFDVVVVGGSYSGIAAALQLARARRSVLVIDSGLRRNRFAHASHGFLGQDGKAPDVIAAEARTQLMAYPSVTWIHAAADGAHHASECFAVATEEGQIYEARRLVLATGVIDDLPDIPGLRERWGKSVFHCPYCHGYELDNGRLGVLATGPASIHQAMLVPEWGFTTFFTNNAVNLQPEEVECLTARGVSIEHELVTGVTGHRSDIQLRDGRMIALDGLFTSPHTRVASSLAAQVGCAFEQGPTGPFIQTDATKETTVAGVFACGDAARAAGTVSLAVGDGAMAGVAAHRSLVFP